MNLENILQENTQSAIQAFASFSYTCCTPSFRRTPVAMKNLATKLSAYPPVKPAIHSLLAWKNLPPASISPRIQGSLTRKYIGEEGGILLSILSLVLLSFRIAWRHIVGKEGWEGGSGMGWEMKINFGCTEG